MGKKKNLAAASLGRKGGLARRKSLTPEQRSESARKAVLVRWHGKDKPKTSASQPMRWYGLLVIPVDPNPPKPGDADYVGGAAAAFKRRDQAWAQPQVLLWSRDRAEIVKRRAETGVERTYRDEEGREIMEILENTEIIEVPYDPNRFTIKREYKPDVGRQLKGLRAVLDTDGGQP